MSRRGIAADQEPAVLAAGPGRLDHLRWGLLATVCLLALGLPVGWLFLGGVGALGFGCGVALVVVSYTVSGLVLAWAVGVDPALIMPFGLVTYATKFTGIVVLLAAVDASGWAGRLPMGMGIIVAAVVWSAAQIAWVVRTRPA